MDAELTWLENDDPDSEAHLCAVSGDTRAAAICGYGSIAKWHRATTYGKKACPKCLAADRSGAQINFKMPNGATVMVRAGKLPL